MLSIVNGSLEDLKSEMKLEIDRIKRNIRSRKKKIRELKKHDPLNTDAIILLEKNIKKDESLLKMFNFSKVQPVQVGNLIVNYAAYQKYVKIVNGVVKESFDQTGYIVRHKTGLLELTDLSKYFEGFMCIPVAELRDETA